MKAAVVILNWNGKKFLEQFLPSVIQHTAQWAEIVVADNASTDDSVNFVRTSYPQVTIVENDRNYGFAAGYNHALKSIDAEYFVLLNSDVEVTPGWLEPLIGALENPGFTAAQPKLLDYNFREYFEYAGAAGGFIDKNYYPFCRGRIFDTLEKDENQYSNSCEIFWASGACLAVKADAFYKVGGFDEDFFAHMEEIDLCARLKNMGCSIGYIGDSVVYHVGGGTLKKTSPFKTFLNYRNNLLLITKNHFTSPLLFKLLWRMVLDGVSAAERVLHGDIASLGAILKAHFAFYGMLPATLRKRQIISSQRNNPSQAGFYRRSILWQYFIRKNKVFSSLENIN